MQFWWYMLIDSLWRIKNMNFLADNVVPSSKICMKKSGDFLRSWGWLIRFKNQKRHDTSWAFMQNMIFDSVFDWVRLVLDSAFSSPSPPPPLRYFKHFQNSVPKIKHLVITFTSYIVISWGNSIIFEITCIFPRNRYQTQKTAIKYTQASPITNCLQHTEI